MTSSFANLREFMSSTSDLGKWRRISWTCSITMIAATMILVAAIASMLAPGDGSLLLSALKYINAIAGAALLVFGLLQLRRHHFVALRNGVASEIAKAVLKQALFTSLSVFIGGLAGWVTLALLCLVVCELIGIPLVMVFGVNPLLGLPIVAVSLALSLVGAWWLGGRRVYQHYSSQMQLNEET